MKLPVVLLSVSLAANAALVATLALRPSLVPPSLRDYFFRAGSSAGSKVKAGADDTAASAAKNAGKKETAHVPLWSTFEVGDLKKLVAQLQAAGFPAYAIRAVVEDRLRDKYEGGLRKILQRDPNTPYWKMPAPGILDPSRVAEFRHLSNEYDQTLRDLLGGASREDGDVTSDERRRFGNLPVEKIDAATRVLADYDELAAQLRASMNDITLPEDREKLALLEKEKHADLATVLSPEELADYDMRNSIITNRLRPAMSLFHPTESEFRAIYNIQLPHVDVLYPQLTRGLPVAFDLDAQLALNDPLKAALGEERFTEYMRDSDRDYQNLVALEQEQHLAAGTAMQAYNLRQALAQESTRIAKDPALDYDQKRAALQTLAQSTRSQLVATLGPVASQTFLRNANIWLTMVENGSPVTFISAAGIGTFPSRQILARPPTAGTGNAGTTTP